MTLHTQALEDVTKYANAHGIDVVYTKDLDPFFKGDLDGQTIWLDESLSHKEKLFNLLHLIGHTIQWATDEFAYTIGSVLHEKPSPLLLETLLRYEREAAGYGKYILYRLGYLIKLAAWYDDMFFMDMKYLTHFYKTGEKNYNIDAPSPIKRLPALALPLSYTPKKRDKSREGIVI